MKKGAKSTWRGHPIVWDGEEWLFKDNGLPCYTGYGVRPCVKCGKIFQGSNNGDPDPCMGILPGVDNACCGHGDSSKSYIRFKNGVVIKGFTNIEYTEKYSEPEANCDRPEEPDVEPSEYSKLLATGIELEVIKDIEMRQQLGIKKYGQTVDENPLTLKQWLQHAYEETLDQAIYLKKSIKERG